jgi:hypothetical protein
MKFKTILLLFPILAIFVLAIVVTASILKPQSGRVSEAIPKGNPATVVQSPTCKLSGAVGNQKERYYVNFTIDGIKMSFTKGRQIGFANEARLPVPYGIFEHTSTHQAGIYHDVDIQSSAQDPGEWTNIRIRTNSDQLCQQTYDGYFAYRSSSFWWQGDCKIEVLETSGATGHLHGTGTCEELEDIKNRT